MTVSRLLDEMDAVEFSEWMQFDQLEPFGGAADDYRYGLAAATTININRQRGAAVVRPLDLFPWHEKRPQDLPVATPDALHKAMTGGNR